MVSFRVFALHPFADSVGDKHALLLSLRVDGAESPALVPNMQSHLGRIVNVKSSRISYRPGDQMSSTPLKELLVEEQGACDVVVVLSHSLGDEEAADSHLTELSKPADGGGDHPRGRIDRKQSRTVDKAEGLKPIKRRL